MMASKRTNQAKERPKRTRCTTKGCRRLAVKRGKCPDHVKGPGRPVGSTELLDTKGAELLEAIRKGRRPATARQLVGLEGETLRRWVAKGEDAERLHQAGIPLDAGEEKYRTFLWEFQRACVDLQAKLEERIADLAPDMEPAEALKVLERLDREVWGRHDTLTVKDGGVDDAAVVRRWAETLGHVIRRVLNAAHLTDEQQERALAELSAALEEVTAPEPEL